MSSNSVVKNTKKNKNEYNRNTFINRRYNNTQQSVMREFHVEFLN